MSVINILMQLRKVCNHPDLFDARPTISPFHMDGIVYVASSQALRALERDPLTVRCLFGALFAVFGNLTGVSLLEIS